MCENSENFISETETDRVLKISNVTNTMRA